MEIFSVPHSKSARHNELAVLFNEHFPNYDIFYNNFIQEMIGFDNHWRPDTYEYLEELGISDFGIIKSLFYIKRATMKLANINQNIENSNDQIFKNSYFHFGLIFDTVDNILKCLVFIDQKLNEECEFLKKKSRDELIAEFKTWIEKFYEKEFEKLKLGMSRIYYYPQQNRDFLKVIVPCKEFRSSYKSFIDEIKTYRNYFTHNPSIDIVGSTKNGLLVVKRGKISKYRTLTDIRTAINIDPDSFVKPSDLLKEDLIRTLRILNTLWGYLITKMDENKQHSKYNTLINGYVRYITSN